MSFLQAVAAPFPEVEFIPTGGIAASHLPAYLGVRRVVACGGSWMAPQAWIAAGQFDRIRGAVAELGAAAASRRHPGADRWPSAW